MSKKNYHSSNKKQEILKKGVNNLSIFNHDKMKEATFKSIEMFVDNNLYGVIQISDLLNTINSFINYKNEKRDNFFHAQDTVISLNNILEMGGVFDPKHVEIFEEIAYKYILSEGDQLERAKKIHSEWRKIALELRDQEQISKTNTSLRKTVN